MSDEYIEKEILKYIGQIQGVGYTKGLKLKDYQKKKDIKRRTKKDFI